MRKEKIISIWTWNLKTKKLNSKLFNTHLLHERYAEKPKTITDRELILQIVFAGLVLVATFRHFPFVGRELWNYVEGETHKDVGGQYVEPDIYGQRIHEREQAGGHVWGYSKENSNAWKWRIDYELAKGERLSGFLNLLT